MMSSSAPPPSSEQRELDVADLENGLANLGRAPELPPSSSFHNNDDNDDVDDHERVASCVDLYDGERTIVVHHNVPDVVVVAAASGAATETTGKRRLSSAAVKRGRRSMDDVIILTTMRMIQLVAGKRRVELYLTSLLDVVLDMSASNDTMCVATLKVFTLDGLRLLEFVCYSEPAARYFARALPFYTEQARLSRGLRWIETIDTQARHIAQMTRWSSLIQLLFTAFVFSDHQLHLIRQGVAQQLGLVQGRMSEMVTSLRIPTLELPHSVNDAPHLRMADGDDGGDGGDDVFVLALDWVLPSFCAVIEATGVKYHVKWRLSVRISELSINGRLVFKLRDDTTTATRDNSDNRRVCMSDFVVGFSERPTVRFKLSSQLQTGTGKNLPFQKRLETRLVSEIEQQIHTYLDSHLVIPHWYEPFAQTAAPDDDDDDDDDATVTIDELNKWRRLQQQQQQQQHTTHEADVGQWSHSLECIQRTEEALVSMLRTLTKQKFDMENRMLRYADEHDDDAVRRLVHPLRSLSSDDIRLPPSPSPSPPPPPSSPASPCTAPPPPLSTPPKLTI